MDWKTYQKEAIKFLESDDKNTYDYLVLGLHSEKGEVAGVVKRFLRGDYDLKETKKRLIGEIGDCLWYVAVIGEKYFDLYGSPFSALGRLVSLQPYQSVHDLFSEATGGIYEEGQAIIDVAKEYNLPLDEIFSYNIKKLTDRAARGVIKGDGDDR